MLFESNFLERLGSYIPYHVTSIVNINVISICIMLFFSGSFPVEFVFFLPLEPLCPDVFLDLQLEKMLKLEIG